MSKRYSFILGLIISNAIAWSVVFYAVVNAAPPDPSQPIARTEQYSNGILQGASEIGISPTTGGIVVVTYDAAGNEIASTPASQSQQIAYNALLDDLVVRTSTNSLKGAAAVLQEWAEDSTQTANDWDTLTATQKDQRMEVLFQRMGIFLDRFADLMIAENRDPTVFTTPTPTPPATPTNTPTPTPTPTATATTGSFPVLESNQDGRYRDGISEEFVINGIISEAGDQSASNHSYQTAMKFTGLNAVLDKAIISAKIVVNSHDTVTPSGGANTYRIRGELSSDPANLSTEADFLARARTTAFVDWTPGTWTVSTEYETTDITSILNEIIATSSPTANLVFFIGDDDSAYSGNGDDRIFFWSYDGDPALAPKLVIEYAP